MQVLHARADGSFVIAGPSGPYHVTAEDPMFAEAAAAALGAVLAPEPVLAAPPVTMADYEAALGRHVELAARARGYKGAASCAGYAASTVPAWAAEAAAFVAWRDQVYLEAFEALAVMQGGGATPSVGALVASLPPLAWPA